MLYRNRTKVWYFKGNEKKKILKKEIAGRFLRRQNFRKSKFTYLGPLISNTHSDIDVKLQLMELSNVILENKCL